MEIKYDMPIEVTRNQYAYLTNPDNGLTGTFAHRYDSELKKFYIKVWMLKYIPLIKEVLNKIK
jgi:hypothetical protein